MRASDRGFTLLEVLAAVSILAILYTTLSTVAMRGLRSEGESQRMLEASLIADWQLSEFEADLEAGLIPEIGVTQNDDEEGFTVVWDVSAYQPAAPPASAAGGLPAPNAQDPARLGQPAAPFPFSPIAPAVPGADDESNARSAADDEPSEQPASGDEAPAPFYQIVLRVSWLEGAAERAVTRTTFAVDPDAAAKLAVQRALAKAAEAAEES
ncbi:MAG TPA: prepilin-type N-terminal cleavage/methylation domain-containing protein [Myxococcota bacterium]|nr:prepilin-type N-terminal cleavage/methylation domain-containing protein [Myxococcota bacterium]